MLHANEGFPAVAGVLWFTFFLLTPPYYMLRACVAHFCVKIHPGIKGETKSAPPSEVDGSGNIHFHTIIVKTLQSTGHLFVRTTLTLREREAAGIRFTKLF